MASLVCFFRFKFGILWIFLLIFCFTHCLSVINGKEVENIDVKNKWLILYEEMFKRKIKLKTFSPLINLLCISWRYNWFTIDVITSANRHYGNLSFLFVSFFLSFFYFFAKDLVKCRFLPNRSEVSLRTGHP